MNPAPHKEADGNTPTFFKNNRVMSDIGDSQDQITFEIVLMNSQDTQKEKYRHKITCEETLLTMKRDVDGNMTRNRDENRQHIPCVSVSVNKTTKEGSSCLESMKSDI